MSILEMVRGDRRRFRVSLTNDVGAALDLTGLDVIVTITGPAGTIVKTTEVDGGIEVADPETGVAVFTLEPEDTEDWEDLRTLTGDVEISGDDDGPRTALKFKLAIEPDITRPPEEEE